MQNQNGVLSTFGGLDLLRPEVIEPTKMPRTAVIPVVRDLRTGYLNAATYSAGVFTTNPLRVLFGPKGADAIDAFRRAGEFCVAVPGREQINHVWVTALEIPHGISEIDVAGWHELASRQIATPGIEECPLNLECRNVFCQALPPPWRTLVIGEVAGVSIDSNLLALPRSEVVKLYPMHEAGSHPDTGLYSPSVLSGEWVDAGGGRRVRAAAETYGAPRAGVGAQTGKTFVAGRELYLPENERVFMNAVWPRPAYIFLTSDEHGKVNALPLCGGSLQSTEPAVQIPLPLESAGYADVKRSGQFVVAVPDRTLIAHWEALASDPQRSLAAAGFTPLKPNMVAAPGLAECVVNMDCKRVMLEDVPGTGHALLVGRRVGVSLSAKVVADLDPARHTLHDRLAACNEFYASFIYAVLDAGGVRRWGFHDRNMLSVRPLPSWGSRYTGGWWGPGPALNYWLIELCQSELISKADYYKVMYWLRLWNNGRLIPHFSEYIDDAARQELRHRLTTLFRMMAWAHRDLEQWGKVREFLAGFPNPPRDHHSGPEYHEPWRNPAQLHPDTRGI